MLKVKCSDFGLLLWWGLNHHLAANFSEVEDFFALDERQRHFYTCLPGSGRQLANEAMESTDAALKVLAAGYRRSFLADRPSSERADMRYTLTLLASQRDMLRSILEA